MTLGLMDPAFIGSLTAIGYDVDTQDYITRVETADGQPLATAVKDAINAFILGCKADGIWNAIKACCILVGARTLAGALTPLVGVAPTNLNFVAADYDRKTGLLGDGISKRLNTNRNNNADPANNRHISVLATSLPTSGSRPLVGQPRTVINGASFIYNNITRFLDGTSSSYTAVNGLIGLNRSESSQYTRRNNGVNTLVALAAIAREPGDLYLFWDSGGGGSFSNARIAFYSIGEALDLALLDARVTRLINEIQFFLNTGLDGSAYDIDTLRYINAGYAAGGTLL